MFEFSVKNAFKWVQTSLIFVQCLFVCFLLFVFVFIITSWGNLSNWLFHTNIVSWSQQVKHSFSILSMKTVAVPASTFFFGGGAKNMNVHKTYKNLPFLYWNHQIWYNCNTFGIILEEAVGGGKKTFLLLLLWKCPPGTATAYPHF